MSRSDKRWLILLGAALLAASVILYGIYYLAFGDAHTLFLHLVSDIAFLPLEVLIVGVIIERLLSRREKQSIRQKLNMVIGAFFSELGTSLLGELLPALGAAPQIKAHLALEARWGSREFAEAAAYARTLDCQVELERIDLDRLKSYLLEKRQFLLGLLENPNLLEHDRFADVLWAIFHLQEELEARRSLGDLPRADAAHLAGDIQRAYTLLAAEWLAYAEHLKANYPYLFSLVLRTHPFQDAPSPTVTA